jgi:cation diffusion facilitator family transporter
MIFIAAVYIVVAAVERLINPVELDNVGIGLAISVVAALVNGGVAVVLLRVGRRERSLTLEADGKHLMTDVWTSAGVVVGVLLVALTGWLRLDPVVALLVGLNIVRAGWQLISASVDGLLDRSLAPETQARIDEILGRYAGEEVRFHAVRTREAGHRSFVTLHLLVPGSWSVQRGHDLAEEVEQALCAEIDACEVSTHIEPIEDPRSYEAELGVDPPA